MRIKKDKKLKYSIATYSQGKGETPIVCLEELAKTLSSVNCVPERMTLIRATEVSMLAQSYLLLLKDKKRVRRK